MLKMGKEGIQIKSLVIYGWFKTVCWEWRTDDTLVRTVHVFSTNIGMEFGIKKCGILTMKWGKIVKKEWIKLPDGEVMKQVGQEGYTYLGIIELDKIKETEMKKKITKECKQRQRLIWKSKWNVRNKVTVINIWAIAIFRYGAGKIQWKASELKDLDRISRKTMMMYGGLHLKSDVDRLYVKRKERSRGLINVE